MVTKHMSGEVDKGMRQTNWGVFTGHSWCESCANGCVVSGLDTLSGQSMSGLGQTVELAGS